MYILTWGCTANLEQAIIFYISPPDIVINSKWIFHAVLAPRVSALPWMINTLETKVFVEQEIGT